MSSRPGGRLSWRPVSLRRVQNPAEIRRTSRQPTPEFRYFPATLQLVEREPAICRGFFGCHFPNVSNSEHIQPTV
jgi:hypothetical protein